MFEHLHFDANEQPDPDGKDAGLKLLMEFNTDEASLYEQFEAVTSALGEINSQAADVEVDVEEDAENLDIQVRDGMLYRRRTFNPVAVSRNGRQYLLTMGEDSAREFGQPYANAEITPWMTVIPIDVDTTEERKDFYRPGVQFVREDDAEPFVELSRPEDIVEADEADSFEQLTAQAEYAEWLELAYQATAEDQG